MRRFVFFFVVLALAHQSTLAAPLPADIQNRVAAVSAGGGAAATSPAQYAGEGDMSLKLWHHLGGQWHQQTLLTSFTYQDVEFSPDRRYLASLDMDDSEPYKRMYRLRIHEVATGKLWREAAGQDAWEQLSWSRDSRYLAVATFQSDWVGDDTLKTRRIDGAVWMWNLANAPQPLPKPQLAVAVGARVAAHGWSPDNRSIAIGLGNGRAQIWTRNDAAKTNEPAFARRFALIAPEGAIEALS